MALQKEVWIADIQENLYVPNPWLQLSKDDSAFVAFKTVHVPQSGAAATISLNPASFPLTATQRTDNELTYNVNDYSAAPFFVTDFENLQLSYDKRQSIAGDYNMNLITAVGNVTAFNWSPTGTSSRVVRTTGATTSTALAPGATGTRNAITLADIAAAKSILDKDGVEQGGRVMIVQSDMYNSQLLAIDNVIRYMNYGSAVLPSGVVNRLHGFDIYIKPLVAVYDSTGIALKAINANGTVTTPATTDNLSCLCYHPNYVSRALEGITVYYNEGKAEYQGDLLSARISMGSKYRRLDFKGVVSIVQQ